MKATHTSIKRICFSRAHRRPVTLLLVTACLMLANWCSAQLPMRKAFIGLIARNTPGQIVADSVLPGSSFAAAGIRKGDVITAINSQPVSSIPEFNSVAGNLRTGARLTVNFRRDGAKLEKTIAAVMRPYETSAIADVLYDWVKFRSGYLRVITRKPKGKTNLAAILLIPGYGCGSIENYMSSYNGKLITEWLRSGYAVVTIEKSGLGDSEGCEPCTEVDLATDIASFEAGYRYMEGLPFVDNKRLFIWGHSMGGTIAPEVAKLHNPKGVMVFASVFRPWNEFLLEMHRVQKPLLDNMTLQQTEKFVREVQPLYSAFFNEKKSPAQLVNDGRFTQFAKNELGYKPGSNNMWGRHWRFWQQLDSLNLAESWAQVKCPVLVIHGEADYEQCSVLEPMMIRNTVNENRPGLATWITIPALDHFMMNSKDWKHAVTNFREQQYAKGNFNYRITEETIKWLNQVNSQ